MHAEPDFLNDGTNDGASIFHIKTKRYAHGSRAARVELNSFELDEQRAIAELMKGSN